MHIVFGLHLDGLKPKTPCTAVGNVTVGPKGMLDVLETQLGLSAATPYPSEAPLSYLQFLREASSPDRFFYRSLQIDPVNVARTLLDWREQWYEAGWDGTFPNDVPARLADMAAVERIAKGRGPLTHGERLQKVAKALAVRDTQIQRVKLHTPLENFPFAWQRIIEALPWVPADSLEPTSAGPPGSDLELLQTKLIAIADRNVDRPAQPESLQGDGSVVVVKAVSRDLSADTIAEFLLTSRQMEGTLLVAEHGGIILDNALERAGLPRCGFQWHSRFRTATQVLKLALALVWEPVDPHRILQYLLHPTGPIPKWVRSRLADAVSEAPGIGGPAWVDAIHEIGQMQRETYGAQETEIEQLRAEIEYWLEGDQYDPVSGAPLEVLLGRTQHVSAWASAQLHIVENQAEAALFAAAQAQAEALSTELAGFRNAGEKRQGRLALERLIDEVTTEAADPSTYEEIAHARATTSPATVTDPWPIVIWWNLAAAPTAVSHPWSRRELEALRVSGVRLPQVDDLIRQQSRDWLKPICNAKEKLVLVVHDDERGMHPVWTQIESLFRGFEKVEIEPALLGGQATLEPLKVSAQNLPLQPLPAPRRWWSLPDSGTLVRREVESYSSLSKLCDYPHEWVLRYAARLRAGRAIEVLDGHRLFGNLGHRVIETFFKIHIDWHRIQDADVLAWAEAELPGIIEREGAVLLAPGRGIDRQRIAATLERALVQLLSHLRSARVEQVTPEASGKVPFTDRYLTGAIDLALILGNGQRAVLDIKWEGESYRSKLLRENRALQLATYSYLKKNLDETGSWPPGAFFILSTGNVLATDRTIFPDAIVCQSEDAGGVADLWDRILVTYDWRWTQLENGAIEVVTEHTAADELSVSPDAGLRPVDGGDPYDSFKLLTGWEGSQ